MVKIVLVTHGHLAQQMLETAGQIIGKPSDDGFATFAVTTAASVEKEAAKLHELLKSCTLRCFYSHTAHRQNTP